jgi:formylglycine-generating enzyme required for sulfatase activity
VKDESDNKLSTQLNIPSRIRKKLLLPDIDWVVIPEGDFGYGNQPLQQRFHHSRFFISRYPITNCQYQTFIDAGGYQEEHWWRDLEKTEPKPPTWPQDNRPREMVSWYEAVAFTRWLSVQLGYEISLPTSLQWEKAARGTDSRDYPWGNSYVTGDANVYDLSAGKENLEQTIAVGMYPHRASFYQVMDMAGNVWEWGIDEFNSELATRQDSNHKVTHGGSWLDVPENARCAFTHQDYVGTHDSRIGFRVVCLSPDGST